MMASPDDLATLGDAECPGCGQQIITGFGKAVPSESLGQFEKDTALEFTR